MAASKTDLTSLSLNQISQLVGMTYRTVKKKLACLDPEEKDGNTLYYNSREALEIIYLGTPEERSENADAGSSGGNINMRFEAARNIKLKNDHLDFDLQVKRQKYVPLEEVRKMWTDRAVAFKSRLRQLAAQLAEEIHGVDDSQKVAQIIERGHDEALNEMADDGIEERPEEADDGDAEEAPSAAEADDFSVG
jgi:hypothetical protein